MEKIIADDLFEVDDDFLGWKVDHVAWNCRDGLFDLRIFITLILPWESSEETIRRLVPGWLFELDAKASQGFETHDQQAFG